MNVADILQIFEQNPNYAFSHDDISSERFLDLTSLDFDLEHLSASPPRFRLFRLSTKELEELKLRQEKEFKLRQEKHQSRLKELQRIHDSSDICHLPKEPAEPLLYDLTDMFQNEPRYVELRNYSKQHKIGFFGNWYWYLYHAFVLGEGDQPSVYKENQPQNVDFLEKMLLPMLRGDPFINNFARFELDYRTFGDQEYVGVMAWKITL